MTKGLSVTVNAAVLGSCSLETSTPDQMKKALQAMADKGFTFESAIPDRPDLYTPQGEYLTQAFYYADTPTYTALLGMLTRSAIPASNGRYVWVLTPSQGSNPTQEPTSPEQSATMTRTYAELEALSAGMYTQAWGLRGEASVLRSRVQLLNLRTKAGRLERDRLRQEAASLENEAERLVMAAFVQLKNFRDNKS